MGEFYLIFSTLTFTYKAKNVLRYKFPKLKIVTTPTSLSKSGCKYAILIKGNLDQILKILESANIPVSNTVPINN